MTRAHRRGHLLIWLVLAPVLLGLLVLGVSLRTSPLATGTERATGVPAEARP